jgi:hypothetical protein
MVRVRCDFTGRGPVRFEGVTLPDEAKGFERLPFWEELAPDVQEWLLDLHYCWGRNRTLASARVLDHLVPIRRGLQGDRQTLTGGLQGQFPGATPEEIADSLTRFSATLDLIEAAAMRTDVCRWTVEPHDTDLERNLTIAIRFVRDGVTDQFPALDPNLPPGFEYRVRTASRERQLTWLAEVSDALTVPRPGRMGRAWEKLQQRLAGMFKPD